MAGKAHQEVPTYEEFEPLCHWQRDEDKDILEIHLQGFKKEQLRVQISSLGVLKISGEGPAGTSLKSRFHKEVIAPTDTYDTQSIQATFINGVLYITMPKIKHGSNGPKVPPRADPTPKSEPSGINQPTVAPPLPKLNDADGGSGEKSKTDVVGNRPPGFEIEKRKKPGLAKVAMSLAATAAALAVLVAYVVYMYKCTVGEQLDDAGKLGPEELSSRDHVFESRLNLSVLTGLEATVRVHPQYLMGFLGSECRKRRARFQHHT
ncbi:small heat-shock protein [Striga asiatica]|uniref:Small heat-shock protein n=1 Tax=Striga asiatica TaxID=4170 RepID=A0A5A7QHG4_STRAF|nr:small heat-shock protein [Striga asiatica]